jgi:hypothetical protein
MSARSRLQRLEKRFAPKDGRCPECGFRPGDIRVIRWGNTPVPEWPPEDYCATCRGLKPPIRFIGGSAR